MSKRHVLTAPPPCTPQQRQAAQDSALAAVPDAQRDAVAVKLPNIPATMKLGYLRACAGGSRAAAIKANCLECVCWVRDEVAKCPMTACPFWGYRPFKP